MQGHLVVSHLEHHPLGNEDTALEVRGLAYDEASGQRYVVGGDEWVLLPPSQESSDQLLALARPFAVEPGEALLVFGPIFTATLMAVEPNARLAGDDDRKAWHGITHLPVDTFGIRVFATKKAPEFVSLLMGTLVGAFDQEHREGRLDGAAAFLLWSAISKSTFLSERELYARGAALMEARGDAIGAENLRLDAVTFSGLTVDELEGSRREYLAVPRPAARGELWQLEENLLALNSKLDLTNNRLNALTDRVTEVEVPRPAALGSWSGYEVVALPHILSTTRYAFTSMSNTWLSTRWHAELAAAIDLSEPSGQHPEVSERAADAPTTKE